MWNLYTIFDESFTNISEYYKILRVIEEGYRYRDIEIFILLYIYI